MPQQQNQSLPSSSTHHREHTVQAGYLTPFSLSREAETDLHDHVRSKATVMLDTVAEPLVEGVVNPDWKETRYKNTSIWERDANAGPTSEYTIRSSAVLSASVDEILQVLDSSKVNAYRSYMSIIYQKSFADASLLYHRSLDPRNTESLSVQWLALRSLNPLVLDLDFCLVDYVKHFQIAEAGQRPSNNQAAEDARNDNLTPVAYKVFESVESKHCPSLLRSHKLERASFSYGGYVLYKTNDALKTRVEFVASIIQPESQIRRLGNREVLKRLASSTKRVQNAVQVNRMSLVLARRTSSIRNTKDESPTCSVCSKAFHDLRRRYDCRLCTSQMCRNCSVYQDAYLPTTGLTSLRICQSCNEKVNPKKKTSKAATYSSVVVENRKSGGTTLLAAANKVTVQQARSIKSLASYSLDDHAIQQSLQVSNVFASQLSDFFENTPYKDILDLVCEYALDSLGCQYAAVTLVDADVNFLKSIQSDKLLVVPTNLQCCAPVIAAQKAVVVPDVKSNVSSSFWKNLPIVKGPHAARFYAGVPILLRNGSLFGAICVFDATPKATSANKQQQNILERLGHLAVVAMEKRHARLLELEASTPVNKSQLQSRRHRREVLLPIDTSSTPEIRLIKVLYQNAKRNAVAAAATHSAPLPTQNSMLIH